MITKMKYNVPKQWISEEENKTEIKILLDKIKNNNDVKKLGHPSFILVCSDEGFTYYQNMYWKGDKEMRDVLLHIALECIPEYNETAIVEGN